MSYEIYHKIKQLPNGDYLVTSKSSNCTGSPSEWTMDYFRRKFPSFTMEQRDAAFIIHSMYWGGKFYPAKYKRMQAIAWQFRRDYAASSIDGAEVWDEFLDPKTLDRAEFLADQFIEFCKKSSCAQVVSARIKLKDGCYITRRKPHCYSFLVSYDKDRAKVYRATIAELREIMDDIPVKYAPELEIVA